MTQQDIAFCIFYGAICLAGLVIVFICWMDEIKRDKL